MLKRLIYDEEGVLTFEWIMLLTLLVIGVVGGVAGVRDAIIHECQGLVGAIVSLDQSYYVAPPLGVCVQPLNTVTGNCTSTASYSSFHDAAIWGVGRTSVSLLAQSVDLAGLCPVP